MTDAVAPHEPSAASSDVAGNVTRSVYTSAYFMLFHAGGESFGAWDQGDHAVRNAYMKSRAGWWPV